MPEKRNLPKKLTYVYLFWWIQWTLMQILVIHHFGFTWNIAAIDSILTSILLTGMMFATNNIMRFYQPYSKNWYMGLVWNLVVAFICILLFKWIQSNLYKDDLGYLTFVNNSLLVRFCCALLMITCSTMISWIWSQLAELRNTEIRNSEIEQLAKDSELLSIRQQLQPHFLFNSLNSISALTGSKPEEARKMIQQLSDFLRGTLRKDNQQMSSLDEELKHLQLYLDIEKVRFGHRLQIGIDIHPDCHSASIPTLLLQPIVENAIKFGIYDTVGLTEINITAFKEGNNLAIQISNPFDSVNTKPNRGTGYGLSSVERRLYLLFGRNDLLHTKKEKDTFITTVKIPQTV